MSKTLDFTAMKAKKQLLTITFIDGNKILVKTPTKHIMDDLLNLKTDFETVESQGEDNEASAQALDEIYTICASIMSNNIGQKKIEVDYLSEVLDLEDLIIFFESYTDFVNELSQTKN